MDKRNENSRKALYTAYMQLLQDNPAAKPKIADLCTAAGVSKSTFYNNYTNLAAFVQDAEKRFVKIIVNSIPRQSYTFETPQLFTIELTLAFLKNRMDIRLLFGHDGIVRMLYLMEKAVKDEIFALYPKHRNNHRMNIMLTYCIMGAANANILNPDVPFETLISTIKEITDTLQPVISRTYSEYKATLSTPQQN